MEDNIFSTKDLHFAAFLKYNNAVLIRLERREDFSKTPVYFVFEDRAKCEHLDNVFWNGQGDEVMVNVKEYVNITRDLRARTSSTGQAIKGTI